MHNLRRNKSDQTTNFMFLEGVESDFIGRTESSSILFETSQASDQINRRISHYE